MQLEFRGMSEVHKFNKIYGRVPKVCDACGSENIYLGYKSPQGNDYYTVECGDCGADANFGILKDNKGLYWKGEKMEVYQGDGQSRNSGGSKQPQGEHESQHLDQDQDLPF